MLQDREIYVKFFASDLYRLTIISHGESLQLLLSRQQVKTLIALANAAIEQGTLDTKGSDGTTV